MILFFIFIFWLRSRTHEIGILLSLGIARGKILLQIAAEAFLGGALALALSFLAAPAVSDAAAGYLTDWQAQQDELQAELDAGGTATEYQAPELTVTDVETELTPAMLLTDGLCVGALILLSTGVAGVLILRRKPADILKGE
ncbi:FtsX-like permease family protein, partial [Marvinbryantia sp.]